MSSGHSEFLLLARCFTSGHCFLLLLHTPTSFILRSDVSMGLTEGFRVIEGVQNTNQLKIDYLPFSWPLISFWLCFLLRLCAIDLAFSYLHSNLFLPFSSLQPPAAHPALLSFQQTNSKYVSFSYSGSLASCVSPLLLAWPRGDDLYHSGRKAQLAAISVCFQKSCFPHPLYC